VPHQLHQTDRVVVVPVVALAAAEEDRGGFHALRDWGAGFGGLGAAVGGGTVGGLGAGGGGRRAERGVCAVEGVAGDDVEMCLFEGERVRWSVRLVLGEGLGGWLYGCMAAAECQGGREGVADRQNAICHGDVGGAECWDRVERKHPL
jgi:hypothetical protein